MGEFPRLARGEIKAKINLMAAVIMEPCLTGSHVKLTLFKVNKGILHLTSDIVHQAMKLQDYNTFITRIQITNKKKTDDGSKKRG
jgi:hypothetical protein